MIFVKGCGLALGVLFITQSVIGLNTCDCHSALARALNLNALPVPHGPVLIRPLIKPNISLPLFGSSPPKGPCFRRQAIVKPAVVPCPIHAQCEAHTEIPNTVNVDPALAAAVQLLPGCSSCPSPQHLSQVASTCQGIPGIDISKAYEKACLDKSSMPADPVSLAIAYKYAQNDYNKEIPEAKIAFGFKALPHEMPFVQKKRYKPTHKERNLYEINGPIVELKPPVQKVACDTLSEEAREELLDFATSEECGEHVETVSRPSLDKLGYRVVDTAPPALVNIPPIPAIPPINIHAIPGVNIPCNDGFKPGYVAYKDYVKDEPSIKPSPPSCPGTPSVAVPPAL